MNELDLTFSALADPTRRGILARLADGEATVSELVEQFNVTQPTISSHLKVLETAGLISRTRVAQTRPCRLAPGAFIEVGRWLEQYRHVWESNYARLDSVLDGLKHEASS